MDLFGYIETASLQKHRDQKRLRELLTGKDPVRALQNGRLMVKSWIRSLEDEKVLPATHSVVMRVSAIYWQRVHGKTLAQYPLPDLPDNVVLVALDDSLLALTEAMGNSVSKLSIEEANYQIGLLYSTLLSDQTRAANGIFYTPPALARQLIQNAEDAGADWSSCRVLDPACGAGAFLLPVAQKIVAAKSQLSAEDILLHLENNLAGYDTDAFGAWLTQAFIETELKELSAEAGRRINRLVTVTDSLNPDSCKAAFDLVIGNPPYGKLKLTQETKEHYAESLYGHPNLYGLFFHLAVNLVSTNGLIAYLTPTSFLSGEYFKKLRILLRAKTAVQRIDFVALRKGIFDDVLQETVLTVLRKCKTTSQTVEVRELSLGHPGQISAKRLGQFALNEVGASPWLLPRSTGQATIMANLTTATVLLKDWGYRVATGPLVWNRHKTQFSAKKAVSCYPVIWAESIIQDGNFSFRASKKNHVPFIRLKDEKWLKTDRPCVLVQRTTAKEQEKRLISAVLPESFLAIHGAVVVENHLNMVLPIHSENNACVPAAVVAAFLNSQAANEVFRTISGSVAVSAFELESMPLPPVTAMFELQNLMADGVSADKFEQTCYQIYSRP